MGVGLAFAWVLGYVLKLLRWRGAKAFIESLVVLATAYLAFYVAQVGGFSRLLLRLRTGCFRGGLRALPCLWRRGRRRQRSSSSPARLANQPPAALHCFPLQNPCHGSGVIAVCIFGLYGSATGHWGMLATDAESGVHEAVWDTVAFAGRARLRLWSCRL